MTYLHALSGSSRPAGPRHRIVPGVPRPLALEARFMFDGAAAAEVVDAVDVAAKSSADCDEGSQPRAFSVDPNSPKAGITREASWLQIDSNPLEIESIRLAELTKDCLLYTSPSPRDRQKSRMPSSA